MNVMRISFAVIGLLAVLAPAFAEEGPGLRVTLEPGTVLHYKGKGETAIKPKAGDVPGLGKRTLTVNSRLFVLSVDASGRARVAVQESLETSFDSPAGPVSRKQSLLDLGIKGRDGSWTRDQDLPGRPREILGALLLGPEVLPKGPLAKATAWKGTFSPKLLLGFPLKPFEAEFRFEGITETGAEKTARIVIDLGEKKPETDGVFSREGFSIEFLEGSKVEYDVDVETGLARRCRLAMTLAMKTPDAGQDANVEVTFAFERRPVKPADPARAAAAAKALALLDGGQADAFQAALEGLKTEAAGSDWAALAEGLLEWDMEPERPGAIAGEEEPAGPLPESFAPSKITLDLKDTTVSKVLKAMEARTGNRISVSKKFNDAALPEFKAEGETFWPVLERLCKVSGNVYGREAFRDGG